MRVLVTGATGFVGPHVVAALRAIGHHPVPVGGPLDGASCIPVDILDAAAVLHTIVNAAPDAIIHLAGQAFIPQAIADPLGTLAINSTGTANVLEAARACRDRMGTSTRVLIVSSADVYGAQDKNQMPVDEGSPVRPANPYAASKLAAETYALSWSRAFNMDVFIARPFNHIGPGQDKRFVAPSFAAQLAAIAAGAPPVLYVGNLEAKRDFVDVRDVAVAYVLLLSNARCGEVYNISSGQPIAIREILRQLITIARVPVEVRDDPERMRPSDLPLLSGDATKLRNATNWKPEISLTSSLRDIYAEAVGARSFLPW